MVDVMYDPDGCQNTFQIARGVIIQADRLQITKFNGLTANAATATDSKSSDTIPFTVQHWTLDNLDSSIQIIFTTDGYECAGESNDIQIHISTTEPVTVIRTLDCSKNNMCETTADCVCTNLYSGEEINWHPSECNGCSLRNNIPIYDIPGSSLHNRYFLFYFFHVTHNKPSIHTGFVHENTTAVAKIKYPDEFGPQL